MSSSDSTVTYTSVSSEDVPFWGIRFFGMEQLDSPEVTPQSPIQTPPVPQDEDKHEPMFIQPHDHDYVPEPMYPEYIPLEDEHVLPFEEKPLPHVVSPTAESPEYVAESNPEEGPEEYEDDETEDGSVDYPIDGEDDGDGDNDDSSGDDAEDEDEDEEEEEEHLAPADIAIIIPTIELVSPPKGTEPVIPPPSTDTTTTGARITVRLQATISLPPEAEVERLLAMPTPLPSPLASLLPPSAGERLARCMALSAWPSVPPVPSPLLPSPGSEKVPEIAPMTVGEDNRTRVSQRVAMNSQWVNFLMEDRIAHQETILIVDEEAYVTREGWAHSIGLIQAVHSKLQTHREQDNQRNVQTARACFYDDFIKCQPLNFKGTEGVVGLTRWIEKMESVFQISGCAIENHVMFATCTMLNTALTWWNSQIRSLGPDAYSMTWEVLKMKMTETYCPQGKIKKLEIELWNLKLKENNVPAYTKRFQELTLICTKFVANETVKIDKYVSGLPDNIYGSVKSSKPKTLDETIELANDLMDQKLCTYAERQTNNKRKADDSFRNNHGHQQQPLKRKNVAKVYNKRTGERKPYSGNLPRPKAVINRRNRVKNVQASASWVWKSVKPNSASIILKRYDYVDVRGRSSFPTSSDVFPLLEEVPTARRKFPLPEEVPTGSAK
nr:reverse transcriptase domain-containing protein [Tanacetum cinerariifolium]